jgi:hypothetical protein
MTGAPTTVTFATLEGRHLARIVDDFMTLVSAPDEDDPALARLTPDAYPGDEASAREFSDATRDDLLERRLEDARVVLDGLTPFTLASSELTEDEALAPRSIAIAPERLDAWLRTLAAIRLVIATRLGITADEQHTDAPGQDVYDWLGYRLELLVQAADDITLDAEG